MFIFENKKTKKLSFIETLFVSQNFLHFTGIKYSKNAQEFFNESLKNRILLNNIKIKDKSFTQLKLEVLENAMSINKSAKKIIAILSKNKNQKLYDEITYISKETKLLFLREDKNINNIIGYDTLFSDNLKYQEKIDDFLELIKLSKK